MHIAGMDSKSRDNSDIILGICLIQLNHRFVLKGGSGVGDDVGKMGWLGIFYDSWKMLRGVVKEMGMRIDVHLYLGLHSMNWICCLYDIKYILMDH